jgi:hypothetical protein
MKVLKWERVVLIYGGSNAFKKCKKCLIFAVDDNIIFIFLLNHQSWSVHDI